MISFRIGYLDAEILAKTFANTFIPRQFVDLDRYQNFVRLQGYGCTAETFIASTLPPIHLPTLVREKLIGHSRDRYAMKRSKVEQRLARWNENW